MLCVDEEPSVQSCLFFFQAEDGIRDLYVTGVQTCALPISTAEGRWWLVDRQGVLLPPTDKKPRLPILITEVAAPAVSPGSHWGDARVKAAARTAGFLQAQLARLHLAESEMEMV